MAADPRSAEILKPMLRGQDVKRWTPRWDGKWLIFAKQGVAIESYPAVLRHLEKFRRELEPRPKDWNIKRDGEWPGRRPGKYEWYELQDVVEYWRLFEQPKIIYQEIQFHPAFALDSDGLFTNNKASIIPSLDLFLLGVLNSPLVWWHNWRYLPHMKDEALSPVGELMVDVPIARPTRVHREVAEDLVSGLQDSRSKERVQLLEVLDWLRVEMGVDVPGQKMEDFAALDSNEFLTEIRKRRPKAAGGLSPALVKAAREVHAEYAPRLLRRRAAELELERRLADLVNDAYGLTPEEVDLMWKTAPPRMPAVRP